MVVLWANIISGRPHQLPVNSEEHQAMGKTIYFICFWYLFFLFPPYFPSLLFLASSSQATKETDFFCSEVWSDY